MQTNDLRLCLRLRSLVNMGPVPCVFSRRHLPKRLTFQYLVCVIQSSRQQLPQGLPCPIFCLTFQHPVCVVEVTSSSESYIAVSSACSRVLEGGSSLGLFLFSLQLETTCFGCVVREVLWSVFVERFSFQEQSAITYAWSQTHLQVLKRL
jgi:hypothetical protein